MTCNTKKPKGPWLRTSRALVPSPADRLRTCPRRPTPAPSPHALPHRVHHERPPVARVGVDAEAEAAAPIEDDRELLGRCGRRGVIATRRPRPCGQGRGLAVQTFPHRRRQPLAADLGGGTARALLCARSASILQIHRRPRTQSSVCLFRLLPPHPRTLLLATRPCAVLPTV